ncbi:MAG TPA: beta-ketoacyl synthase N-terminal-like domain-containing protein [Vicinamibacterales bacterium]|nr:beta-ketoacyl synthase N-terminal-like domain-containing protein [Vicinamibacterales bacterium]
MVTYGPVREPVRVAGLGVVSVFGTTLDAFRDRLLAGQSGIVAVTRFDTAGCRSTIAAEIAGFDPSPFVPAMKMRRMDRTAVYTVAATKLALEDAGAAIPAEGDDRKGVVLGTWTAGGGSTQQFLDALFRHGPTGAPALLFDSTVANSAASIAGLEHRLRGPNMTVSHKEASGLAAIVAAVDLLREGRATALITGGADAIFEPFYKAHDRFAVMSPQRSASAPTAPFDACRDGFVLGEGAAGLWVEPAGAGERRAMHGEILGVASSSANLPLNAWPDRPAPLVRTMRLALDDAGLAPDAVDVVYASANATRQLDAVEADALTALFGDSRTVITSIKGAIGESGTAGSAACAAALLCGRTRQVPPIAGLAEPDSATTGLRLATTSMTAPGPIALVNSFSSGGALFCVVLRARP